MFQPEGTVLAKEQWCEIAWQEQGKAINTSTPSYSMNFKQEVMEGE